MSLEAIYRLDPTQAVQRWLCRPELDLPMQALTIAGEGWALCLLVGLLAWRSSPDRREALRRAALGLAALAVTGAIVVVAKRYFGASRPLQLLGPAQVRVLLEPLRLNSFPSGHSAGAAAFAAWAALGPPVRRWPWLFAFGVGLSRVYVGAHWVTDVLAGWTLGVVVAVAVRRAWTRARPARLEGAEASEGAP